MISSVSYWHQQTTSCHSILVWPLKSFSTIWVNVKKCGCVKDWRVCLSTKSIEEPFRPCQPHRGFNAREPVYHVSRVFTPSSQGSNFLGCAGWWHHMIKRCQTRCHICCTVRTSYFSAAGASDFLQAPRFTVSQTLSVKTTFQLLRFSSCRVLYFSLW